MSRDYTIRKAEINDISSIMKFIKENWSETHILANSRDFFEYQHISSQGVDYIISERNETKEITAILGYIPYGKSNADIMLALWKSIDRSNPVLGMELLEYLMNNLDRRIVACCGINRRTLGIYSYFGYKTGLMEHFYRLNDKSEYKLAVVNTKDIPRISLKREYQLVEYLEFAKLIEDFSFDDYKQLGIKPFKEPWYIEKRYFSHPVYIYKCYGIKDKLGMVKSVLFAREQEKNGVKILRFVDFIGNIDDLQYISYEIDRIISSGNYEYADFYQHGISKEVMNKAGFSSKKDSNNIIPNYFEPYVAENIDIYYCTMDEEDFVIFKGDGDQDRPNYYGGKEYEGTRVSI